VLLSPKFWWWGELHVFLLLLLLHKDFSCNCELVFVIYSVVNSFCIFSTQWIHCCCCCSSSSSSNGLICLSFSLASCSCSCSCSSSNCGFCSQLQSLGLKMGQMGVGIFWFFFVASNWQTNLLPPPPRPPNPSSNSRLLQFRVSTIITELLIMSLCGKSRRWEVVSWARESLGHSFFVCLFVFGGIWVICLWWNF